MTGWRSLETFNRAQDALNEAAIDGNPVASTLREWVTAPTFPLGGWTGTMTELLAILDERTNPHRKEWPRTPRVLSGRITQSAPALRSIGIRVERATGSKKNGRLYDVTHTPPT
ncbi:ATP-binding protein [Streptomyces sp. NBRC 110611]|uniref:hypothetical protein n=1 Tax=Streptomyces sp. NBRC 110611 TaxID=1621259 RepID=UPI0008570154|nr:hypothetical protein [Streptomyces sp. NBRC 110611]GAU67624.1 ATP-binding protein [Streptomyces sp. NBRC 110611]